MKGLFIIFEALSEHSGISKKIKAQVEGFINNGIEMELSSLVFDNTKEYNFLGRGINDEIIENFSKINFINKFQRIICFNKLLNYILINKIDFVYIRYVHIANPFFIRFLKKLKKNNIKILLEVPTYPYDDEYQNASAKQKLLLVIERKFRKKFRDFVDFIITFSNATSIFEVPTVKINNGIDG